MFGSQKNWEKKIKRKKIKENKKNKGIYEKI